MEEGERRGERHDKNLRRFGAWYVTSSLFSDDLDRDLDTIHKASNVYALSYNPGLTKSSV